MLPPISFKYRPLALHLIRSFFTFSSVNLYLFVYSLASLALALVILKNYYLNWLVYLYSSAFLSTHCWNHTQKQTKIKRKEPNAQPNETREKNDSARFFKHSIWTMRISVVKLTLILNHTSHIIHSLVPRTSLVLYPMKSDKKKTSHLNK